MDRLICRECATEVLCHYEAMLADCVLAACEVAEFDGYGDDPVTVAEMAITGGVADRLLGLNVAELSLSTCVRLAELSLRCGPVAPIDSALIVHSTSYRSIRHHVAKAQKSK